MHDWVLAGYLFNDNPVSLWCIREGHGGVLCLMKSDGMQGPMVLYGVDGWVGG